MNSQIGVKAQVFFDGRDISRFLRSVTMSSLLGAVQDTKFRTPGYAHTFVAGLRGGTIGFAGDLPSDGAEASTELEYAIGSNRGAHNIMVCPAGAEVGYLARIGHSLRSQFSSDTVVDGLISMSGDFEKTAGSPGVVPGLCLWSPNGAGTIVVAPSAGTDLTTGVTATASSSAGVSYPASNAFNDDVAVGAWGSASGLPQWLQIDLGSAKAPASYRFHRTGAGGTPVAWTLRGADDSGFTTNVVTLDTQSGQPTASGWSGYYALSGAPARRYWRWDFSANQAGAGASGIELNEVELLSAADAGGTYTDLNVVTATATGTGVRDNLSSVPASKGGLFVLQVLRAIGSGKTCTVRIEHAPDSSGSPGTWATLGTFTAMTDTGAQLLEIASGTTINPHLRAIVTSITGSFVFAVGAWRRY